MQIHLPHRPHPSEQCPTFWHIVGTHSVCWGSQKTQGLWEQLFHTRRQQPMGVLLSAATQLAGSTSTNLPIPLTKMERYWSPGMNFVATSLSFHSPSHTHQRSVMTSLLYKYKTSASAPSLSRSCAFLHLTFPAQGRTPKLATLFLTTPDTAQLCVTLQIKCPLFAT
jgi:hypothetical protein